MPAQGWNVSGEAPETPVWIGSYELDIREECVRLPCAWRPKTPLSAVFLVWENEYGMRIVQIVHKDWLDQQQMDADSTERRLLLKEEGALKPDGLIRLPDIFLKGFPDLSDACAMLVGMYRDIEIYRPEDYERMTEEAAAQFEELCQELLNVDK